MHAMRSAETVGSLHGRGRPQLDAHYELGAGLTSPIMPERGLRSMRDFERLDTIEDRPAQWPLPVRRFPPCLFASLTP